MIDLIVKDGDDKQRLALYDELSAEIDDSNDSEYLSEEQINEFENLIKESLINKIPLEFTIYDNGYTKNIKGTVTKIDSSLNKIFLNYNNHIFFCEIMNIKKLDYFLS